MPLFFQHHALPHIAGKKDNKGHAFLDKVVGAGGNQLMFHYALNDAFKYQQYLLYKQYNTFDISLMVYEGATSTILISPINILNSLTHAHHPTNHV